MATDPVLHPADAIWRTCLYLLGGLVASVAAYAALRLVAGQPLALIAVSFVPQAFLLASSMRVKCEELALHEVQRPYWLVGTLLLNFGYMIPYVFENASPAAGDPIQVMLVALLAPVAEELVFRGWLWTALRRTWPTWRVLLFTSAIFGAIHYNGNILKVLGVLLIGLLFGFLRARCETVVAPIILHCVHNLLIAMAPENQLNAGLFQNNKYV